MADNQDAALTYAALHRERFIEELKALVRIPSVSTDPVAKPHMQHAADWVVRHLQSLGMQNAKAYDTAGHPVVYGELLQAGPQRPTVLIYGHYDVQPAEPLELWISPPFEPTVRGDNLYGRGASDMKGQVIITLKAIEALARSGGVPINVKVLVEGEEEIGSPNLEAFIEANQSLLACDFSLNADGGILDAETPSVTYGLRGLAYFEIRVSGPDHDLHSGLYGGVVHNPAQVLCELVAGMHDDLGRITLPGFYDKVRPLEAEERQELAKLPTEDRFYLEQTGAPLLYGEEGYTALERVCGRPSLEVNGLLSGFTGEGSKTVLPAKAMAKISMRLVPDQDPDEVRIQLQRYLETNAPDTVRWELIQHARSHPSLSDLHTPGVIAISRALEETWGKRPLFKREGGSVPVVAHLRKILGVDSVLTGFGLPDDNLHAPNEKIHLPTFYRGIDTIIRFLTYLAET